MKLNYLGSERLSDLYGAVGALRIYDINLSHAGQGFQTSRQVGGFIPSSDDHADRQLLCAQGPRAQVMIRSFEKWVGSLSHANAVAILFEKPQRKTRRGVHKFVLGTAAGFD